MTPNTQQTTEKDSVHEAYFGHEHVTVIEPSKGWRMLDLRELWAYRELLFALAVRDIKVRYKQSVLGAGWAIIRPVVTMVIFSIIFGGLAKMPSDGFPYPVFVYAGLLPWTFFANSLSACGSSMVSSAHLISKVYFPRLILPVSTISVNLVDLLVATSILFVIMWFYDVNLTPNILFAPFLLVAVVFTALGVGTLLSALAVAYRDFNHLLPFMVQIWLYITPVIYPISLVPENWRWALYINPMTGLTEGFRAAFLGTPMPVTAMTVSMLISIVIFASGVAYFEKVERRFADII